MPRSRKARSPKVSAHERQFADLIARHVDALVAVVTREVRHSVAAEVKNLLRSAPRGNGQAARRPRKVKRRVLPCIAPSCGNPSKGPRFHYLCDKHRDTPKKQYEAWRAAKLV